MRSLTIKLLALFIGILSMTQAGCSYFNPEPKKKIAQVLQPLTAAATKDLAALPGAQVTIVNIWATWCAPCKAEMPELVRIYKNYSAQQVRLVLISADSDETIDDAQEFLKQAGADFPTFRLGESPEAFAKSIEPRWTATLPATFIYDSRGRQSTFWVGQATYEELEAKIRPLLKNTPSSQATPPIASASKK